MTSPRTLQVNTTPTAYIDGRAAIARTYCLPDKFKVYYVDPTTGQDNCDDPMVITCGNRNGQWPSPLHFLTSIGVEQEDAVIELVKK